ncbi:hypothetical protein ACOSP7_013051 [Xanthoceras sorbifolium]
MPKLLYEVITRRFIFDGSKIAALQDKIGNQATCFEAAEIDGFPALNTVNLRNKMNLRIPRQRIGNIHTCKSVNMINDDYVTKGSANAGILSCIGKIMEVDVKTAIFFITIWCRLTFHKADFGWGNPIWLMTTLKFEKGAVLLDVHMRRRWNRSMGDFAQGRHDHFPLTS